MLAPIAAVLIWNNLAGPQGWHSFLPNEKGWGGLLRFIVPMMSAGIAASFVFNPYGAFLIAATGILISMTAVHGDKTGNGVLQQYVSPGLYGVAVFGLGLLGL